MTLDEAIIHAKKAAKRNEEYAKIHAHGDEFEWEDAFKYEECAKEHRQLAEWLKELQSHRRAWMKVKRTVKAYLMLEEFGSEYQDDIENLIDGCIPKEGDAE